MNPATTQPESTQSADALGKFLKDYTIAHPEVEISLHEAGMAGSSKPMMWALVVTTEAPEGLSGLPKPLACRGFSNGLLFFRGACEPGHFSLDRFMKNVGHRILNLIGWGVVSPVKRDGLFESVCGDGVGESDHSASGAQASLPGQAQTEEAAD